MTSAEATIYMQADRKLLMGVVVEIAALYICICVSFGIS